MNNKQLEINISVLNSYLFAKEGHKPILKKLNSVRHDYNKETFEYIKILNTFKY